MFAFSFVVMWMVKMTIMLREDLKEVLKKKYGARGTSNAMKRVSAEALLKKNVYLARC